MMAVRMEFYYEAVRLFVTAMVFNLNPLLECVDDAHERFCFKGCSADKATVNVGFCK